MQKLVVGCINDNRFPDDPLGVAVFFLPAAAAVCGVGIDLVMANRAPLTGMFIARVLVPLMTLFILVATNQFVTDFTATVYYGAGSVAGATYCTTAFLWSSPRQLLTTKHPGMSSGVENSVMRDGARDREACLQQR